MNVKVFKKMGFSLAKDDIEAITKCENGTIEKVLRLVQLQVITSNFYTLSNIDHKILEERGETDIIV